MILFPGNIRTMLTQGEATEGEPKIINETIFLDSETDFLKINFDRMFRIYRID